MLSSIIWLRTRLIARVLFSRNTISLWLIVFGFFAFLVYAIVAAGMSATVVSLILEEPTYLSAALFILFLFLNAIIIAYVLVAGGLLRNAEFCYRKLSHLPMKAIGFYFAESLVSFVDVWFLILIPCLLGTIFGLHLYSETSMFLATSVIFIFYLLLVGFINQFVLYFVDSLFRHIGARLSRFLAYVFLLFGSLVLFWPVHILNSKPAEVLSYVRALLYEQQLFLSPIGLVADGIAKIVIGNYAEIYYIHLPALLGYLVLFFFLGYYSFKLSERLRIERLQSASRKPKFDLLLGFDRLMGLIWTRNERLRVLFAKELTYILRSPRVTMFCTFGVAVAFVQFRSLSPLDGDFLLVLFVPLFNTMVILSDLLPYIFSYDEKGIIAYCFSPIKEDEMVLSKNLSLLFIAVLFHLTVCGLGWLELREVFSAEIIQGLMILGFYIYFISAIASNYSTITHPKRGDYVAIVGRSFRRATFVFCLFATAVPVLAYNFLWNDLRSMATGLSFMAMIIYVVSLKPLSRKLAENKEDFVQEISG